MLVKLLIRLILGYVRIEVEGYYIERFINICTINKIFMWNLKREKGVKLYLNIGIKDFKKLNIILRKTNCKVRIKNKRGIPFLLNRYKKRKIFLVCLIIVIALIYASSKFIWNIEINVKDNYEIKNIQDDLREEGLKRGAIKSKLNIDEIINNIKLKRNDISWMGIDLKGTNIKINIVKAEEPTEILDNTKNCDIVARKDGIINRIIAQNGTAMVKPGDKVKKGDVLIAGYMEGKYTGIRYVHSLGEVTAKIIYKKEKSILFEENIKSITGKKENKYGIKIGNNMIKLYFKKSKYDLYKTETKETKLFKNISMIKTVNEEQIIENVSRSVEEAVNLGKEELSKEIESKIENKENIINKKIEFIESENAVIVTVIYEVEENIGIKKEN